MRQDFVSFSHEKVGHFLTASQNIIAFLPYFFSAPLMLKTLFSPWKRITGVREEVGFSFNDFFNKLSFDFISRYMGATIRSSILVIYICAELFFILTFPFTFLLFTFTLPLQYLLYRSKPTPAEEKAAFISQFVKAHLLNEKNRDAVLSWAQQRYTDLYGEPWWSAQSLFSTIPIGIDWTAGYTPMLSQYTKELHVEKIHNKMIVGRDNELKQIEETLLKNRNASVLLVGEDGVGKAKIIQGLSNRIYEGAAGPQLRYKRIMNLDMESILSQEKDKIARSKAVTTLLKEAAQAGDVVLTMLDCDRYLSGLDGRIDLSALLSESVDWQDLHIIGTTTPFAYQKYIYPNKKLVQGFTKIDIKPIGATDTLKILCSITPEYEKKYHVTLPYETLWHIIQKTDIHIPSVPQPEKSIDLLDEVCIIAANNPGAHIVSPDIVDDVLTKKTSVPVRLTEDMQKKLLGLEDLLKGRIIQQHIAIQKIAATLRKSFVVARSSKKPLGSFLLLGPTGVGKTETAKALAATFFNSDKALIRFDMSNYQSQTDIPRLIGDNQTNQVGLITQAIREQPYGILLLDEIEKAHKDLLNIFLSLLDEGYFTDGMGQKVDCKNLIIMATSNAGAQYLIQLINQKDPAIESKLVDYLIEHGIYSPEFLNRFDGVVVYDPLTPESVSQLAWIMLNQTASDIKAHYNLTLQFTDEYITSLIAHGYDIRFGARNLQRVIRDEVEDKVAKYVLENKNVNGGILRF